MTDNHIKTRKQLLKAKALSARWKKLTEQTLHFIEKELKIISYTSDPERTFNKWIADAKIKNGRPKMRNDQQIRSLRKQGLTMRAIAQKSGHSLMQVQRALKMTDTVEEIIFEGFDEGWNETLPVKLIAYKGGSMDLHRQTGSQFNEHIAEAEKILAKRGLKLAKDGRDAVGATGYYQSVIKTGKAGV